MKLTLGYHRSSYGGNKDLHCAEKLGRSQSRDSMCLVYDDGYQRLQNVGWIHKYRVFVKILLSYLNIYQPILEKQKMYFLYVLSAINVENRLKSYCRSASWLTVIYIHVILLWRAKPGFCLHQSSPYRPFCGWFGPAMWPLGPPQSPTMLVFGVGSGMIALDLTFLWHFSVTITWQMDKNFHTLPCQH